MSNSAWCWETGCALQTADVIGWCICLQDESLGKYTRIRKMKGSLYCDIHILYANSCAISRLRNVFYSHRRNTSGLKAGRSLPAQQNLELDWISISSVVIPPVVHRSEDWLSAAITLWHRIVSGFLTCRKVWAVYSGLRPQLKQSHEQFPATFSGFFPHCACARRQTRRFWKRHGDTTLITNGLIWLMATAQPGTLHKVSYQVDSSQGS